MRYSSWRLSDQPEEKKHKYEGQDDLKSEIEPGARKQNQKRRRAKNKQSDNIARALLEYRFYFSMLMSFMLIHFQLYAFSKNIFFKSSMIRISSASERIS